MGEVREKRLRRTTTGSVGAPGIVRRDDHIGERPQWIVCRQWFRTKKATGEQSEAVSDRQPLPDQLAEWEQQHLLRLALRRLGGDCEQLLVALYCNNGATSYQDVAAKLDMPEGSIGPVRARCLRKLSDILSVMEGKP